MLFFLVKGFVNIIAKFPIEKYKRKNLSIKTYYIHSRNTENHVKVFLFGLLHLG